MRPRMKICCMASPAEAEMAAAAGADLVGLVGPMPSGAGIVSAKVCQDIAMSAPAWVTPVLLSSSETSEELAEDVKACGARALQIVRHVTPAVHQALAVSLPGVRRIQVIHVEDADAIDLVAIYGTRPDAFLLDSGRPNSDELGGTGRTHDWDISAKIVRSSPKPTFLAGGLTPDNAAEAMATVKPFGLDVCSGVRTGDRLDADKLRAFMEAVA